VPFAGQHFFAYSGSQIGSLEGTVGQRHRTTINLNQPWLSPEPALATMLAFAMILLTLGCGTQLQPTDPKENPAPTVVTRTWTFEKFTNGNDEAVPIGDPRSQIDGVVNDSVELGALAVTTKGEDSTARLEAFSNETGFTYWVASQAPSGQNLADEITLGGDVDLDQYQFFQKQDGNASLRFVVTEATLETFDDHTNHPDVKECGWAGHSPFDDCSDVIETDLELGYDMCGLNDAGQIDNNLCFNSNDITAYLRGWRDHWIFTAGLGDGASGSCVDRAHPEFGGIPCIDWRKSDFNFDPDAEGNKTGSHALATLKQPIVVNIPLDGIDVGKIFAVNIEVTSTSFNHRQGETYAGSKFRDPAKVAGVSIESTGIVPVKTDLPRPRRAVIQPAPVCTKAPDPQAGTIQFAEANYVKAEVPGRGGVIEITRTGGSKGEVSVLLTTSDGTALAGKDYEAVSKVIRFGDGDDIEREIPVKILTDKEIEPDETVQLTLSDPRGCAQLGAQTTATLTILDDDSPVTPPPAFAIGGTVTGLAGTGLTLRNNQNAEQIQPGNGAYTFPTRFLDRTNYDVAIVSQPANPVQVCSLKNGSGTIAAADVTNIDVDCVTPAPVGSLDPTFGSSGMATFPLPAAKSVALQSDGKLVVVGDMTLSRYSADGTADTTFGSGGKVTAVANGGPEDALEAVAIQSDGKIVVAGHTSKPPSPFDDFAVLRFNPDGRPDTTFGNGGLVITDFTGLTDRAEGLAIQPDGKILAAGFATQGTVTFGDSDFAVIRYLSDGTLDSSFGNGGKVTTDLSGGSSETGAAVAVQSDGRIVVVGRAASSGGSDTDFGVVRYLPDGRPDGSFATTTFGLVEGDARDVAIQSDGKVVVEGSANFSGSFRYVLARLNSDGTLDKGFGVSGLVNTDFTGQDDFAHALALQADGKLVVAGGISNRDPKQADFGIARYLPDGTLDTSFGNQGGLARIDFFGAFDNANDLVIQSDGKIIAVGSAQNGSGGGLAMVRVIP
jgi:uncharacterized delta-60 repeat protein